MEIFKKGVMLISALSVTGCVLGVTDYYEDEFHCRPAPPVVVADCPVVVDRPVVVRQRPIVVREHAVVVHPRREQAVIVRPHRSHEVIVTRPHRFSQEEPAIVRPHRYREEEAVSVRPHRYRQEEAVSVRPHRYRHEDETTAVVHPQTQGRNDRDEPSSVVVQRWDKTRNAPPSTVAERPESNNESTTVVERQ